MSGRHGCVWNRTDHRTAAFLSCIGDDAVDIFESFSFGANEDIAVLPDQLQPYCFAGTNGMYETYQFGQRNQGAAESLRELALRSWTISCTGNGTGASVNYMSATTYEKVPGDHLRTCLLRSDKNLLMHERSEVRPIGEKIMQVVNPRNMNTRSGFKCWKVTVKLCWV